MRISITLSFWVEKAQVNSLRWAFPYFLLALYADNRDMMGGSINPVRQY